MITVLSKILDGVNEVLFPSVCIVCGFRLSSNEHAVCTECMEYKFEPADIRKLRATGAILLPEGILLQHALWVFDKGGHLQDLMHQLKYNRLIGVGVDVGRYLGKSLMNSPFFMDKYDPEKMILLPVPLHPRKRRIRGYNQAFYIAKGVSDVTGIEIAGVDSVQRVKNTKTQTGFTLEKRRKNIDMAFAVEDSGELEDRICIIVDDVFTTGATTFELASELKASGVSGIMIATVAQA